MIQIDIRGMDAVQRQLSALGNQMPYALSVALNNAAFAVRAESQKDLTESFDRPTRLVTGATRVSKATKATLEARVNIDPKREGIVAPHEFGGRRGPQLIERFLIGKGWMPSSYKAVPGIDMPLDGYGNPRRSVVNQIVTELQAGISGVNGSRRRCFVIRVGQRSHLVPGIYRIKNQGRALSLLYVFVPTVVYRKRLQWEERMNAAALKVLPDAARRAVERALETAR